MRHSSSPDWRERPIFIAGMPKSGTTLLARLLDGHGDYFIMPKEPPFIKKAPKRIISDEKKLAQFAQNSLLNHIRGKFSQLSEDSGFRDKYEELASYLEGIEVSTVKKLYMDFASLFAKTYKIRSFKLRMWGFKNVGNTNIVSFLKYFPHGKIIYLRRDPRGFFASRIDSQTQKMRMPKGIRPKHHSLVYINMIMRDWLKYERIMNKIYKKYGEEKVHIVNYEPLVVNTEETIERILTFLRMKAQEVCYVPTLLGVSQPTDTALNPHMDGRSVYKSSADRWKKDLSWFTKILIDGRIFTHLCKSTEYSFSKSKLLSFGFMIIWYIFNPILILYANIKSILYKLSKKEHLRYKCINGHYFDIIHKNGSKALHECIYCKQKVEII